MAGENFNGSDGTTPKSGLGDTTTLKGAQYQYFKAAGVIAQYAACTVATNFDAVEGTTTTSGARPTAVCIPQFAVALGEYFWAPIGPFRLREDGTPFKVKAAASCVLDAKLYTTAVPGVVDDTAADLIAGLFLTETIVGAGPASCMAIQPLVTNAQD